MSQAKVGKAKFGGDFVKKTYWKLKDGESTFRILPPIGDSACESGRWSQYYEVHYGYKNSKGQMRVFISPLVKNRKTKMVEVPDAALERIEVLRAKQTDLKAQGDEVNAKKVGELLQQYNLDKNHYVNAMDEQGNIGILKLRYRAKQALDVTIKELRDQGTDPLDCDTGRFFVFRRSGNGLDTTFKVTVKQRELDLQGVGKVKQDIVHVLDETILNRLGKEAADLEKLYKRPTSEEVERIVKESNLLTGCSRAVDEILDAKKDDAAAAGDEEEEEQKAPTTPPVTQAAPAQAAPVQAPAQTPPPAQNTAASAPATNVTQSLSQPTATKTTAQAIATQSDDEFLASLNPPA